MKNLKAIISLTRPLNCLITFFTIFVACLICAGSLNYKIFFLAGFVGALVNAGGNIINDYYDVEIDKINRPNRPIASNHISSTNALKIYTYIVFFLLLLSYYNLGMNAFGIVVITTALMFLYSYKLKGIPLFGNFIVSFSTGLAFLFGSVVVGNIYCGIIPAVFAFLISFMRELVKDIEDIEGDKNIGISTFPIKYGIDKTVKLISIVGITLMLATTIPFLLNMYNFYYLIFVTFFVNGILLFVIKKLKNDISSKSLRSISNALKFGMVLGVISIIIGTKL